MKQKYCPCKSKKYYTQCCQPLIKGDKRATGPLDLMRSRFTAYSIGNIPYIQDTCCNQALENFDFISAQNWAQSVTFTNLTIHSHQEKRLSGEVHFTIHYIENSTLQFYSETSHFIKQNNQWLYASGNIEM